VTVELETADPLRSVYSPSHPVEVARHGPRRAVIGWEARDVRPDTDFQLFYSADPRSDVGLSVMTYRDGSGDGYFLLLASPSAELEKEKVLEKDVVFVLDTSGSMAQDDKLEKARRALVFCLQNLDPGDRFQIVRFSTETETLFEGLVAASRENIAEARAFIQGLRPMGGTAIDAALTTALAPAAERGHATRPYFVLFLTDGKPTVGSTDDREIVGRVTQAMGEQAIRVFSFGIGSDVNTHLLDMLSQRTRATVQYLRPREDMELKISRLFTKISEPVLAGPSLGVGGAVRISKLHPTVLPDLFKGEQLVLVGRYSGKGDALLTVQGTVNGRKRSFTNEASFPARATEHGFIPRLWAMRRVGFLLDEIRLNGESPELRDEVARLARRYGIVTPYTAYLIVEDEDKRAVPPLARTLQTIGSDARLRGEARRMYLESNRAKSGDAAVGGAEAHGALRGLGYVSAPDMANERAWEGQTGRFRDSAEMLRKAMDVQVNRHVAGRTFFLNRGRWIDASVQARPEARRVRVGFGSDAYFELLRRDDGAPHWLSLGTEVTVLLDGTVYEIVE
jgi:Ca-activated chloride channel family protein